MMTGGIDLSVGPLTGLVVVVGSFTPATDTSPLVNLLGWLAVPLLAVVVGAVNWLLIVPFRISPMIATLAPPS